MEIVLRRVKCPHCKETFATHKADIKNFGAGRLDITESTIGIWRDKTNGNNKCYGCKKKPEVGEKWGLAIMKKGVNRMFCPKCSVDVDKQINKQKKKIKDRFKKIH